MKTATQILVIVFFGQALANTLDDCKKCSKNDLMKCVVNYNQSKEYFKGDESCSELTNIRECVDRFETTCGWTDLFETAVGSTYQFRLKEVDCGFHGKTEQEGRICYKKHYNGANSTCPEIKKLQTCVQAIVPITEHDRNFLPPVTGTADILMNRLCSISDTEAGKCFNKHYVDRNSTCPEFNKLETCVHAIVPVTDYDRHSLSMHRGFVHNMTTKAGCLNQKTNNTTTGIDK